MGVMGGITTNGGGGLMGFGEINFFGFVIVHACDVISRVPSLSSPPCCVPSTHPHLSRQPPGKAGASVVGPQGP